MNLEIGHFYTSLKDGRCRRVDDLFTDVVGNKMITYTSVLPRESKQRIIRLKSFMRWVYSHGATGSSHGPIQPIRTPNVIRDEEGLPVRMVF